MALQSLLQRRLRLRILRSGSVLRRIRGSWEHDRGRSPVLSSELPLQFHGMSVSQNRGGAGRRRHAGRGLALLQIPAAFRRLHSTWRLMNQRPRRVGGESGAYFLNDRLLGCGGRLIRAARPITPAADQPRGPKFCLCRINTACEI